MTLTDFKIRKAKSRTRSTISLGLFVLVNPNGSKLWRRKYSQAGKKRLMTHGSYPSITLRDAKQKRDDIRTQLEAGNDPTVQKRLDQIEADATMREKHWHVHTLAEALHHRPINEITSAEILHLLKKVEHSGRHETAKKLRGTLSAIFRLAIVTLRADNDPTQAVKGALLPVEVTNRAAITDERVFGQFLRDPEAYTGAGVIKDTIFFQILTMTRLGEVRGAKQHEFD